ncbi:MAG TPA: outer membrane protein transport protein [Pseudomonadales bacterium]|nr:outer membrane protein transport protein [Pseudomonadales bacterium]
MKNKYLFCLLVGAYVELAHAQGYQVDELSVRRLGDAFSGGAASANDASTAHYNPAGLTHLRQIELAGGVTALSNRSTFSGQAVALDPADTAGGGTGMAPISGGDRAVSETRALIPSVYLAVPLDAATVMGVILNTPFGSGTDYPMDDVTRYQGARSDVQDVRLGLSVGRRLNSQISLGGALLADRLTGEIENAIPSSAFCSLLESFSSAGTCSQAGLGPAGSARDDGRVKLSSDDVALGYTLGALFDLSDSTRVGVAYKSKIKHSLEGKADFSMPANAASLLSPFSPLLRTHREHASLNLTTPASLSLSAFHQYDSGFSLQADVTWTQWSVFNTLTVDGVEETLLDQPQDWKNNWRVAVGGDYQLDSAWALRSGLAWDQSPVKKARRSLSFPLDDYRAISVGASYSFSSSWTLDLAAQKTLNFDSNIEEGSLMDDGARLDGRVRSQSWSVAAGVRWKL